MYSTEGSPSKNRPKIAETMDPPHNCLMTDTMSSKRPFQDVLALNDFNDLYEMEIKRRKRAAELRGEIWIDENMGLFQRIFRKNGNGENKPVPTLPLDANVYATKKTIAQGLLDVALLTANASQLKYLLQVGTEHEFYYAMLVLISLSIILQMCLGSVLILKGRSDINDPVQQRRAERLNNASLWIVYASTVVHAFLAVFHIKPKEQHSYEFYWKNLTASSNRNS